MRMLDEVILMVIFRPPKRSGGSDFSGQGPRPLMGLFHLFFHLFSYFALFFTVIENSGAVLSSDVVALLIESRRVVHSKKVS